MINVDQLSRLAHACRRILAGDPAPATVAIPYLHVLNAHPNSTARYDDLFSGRSALRRRLINFMARQALRGLALIRSSDLFSGDPLPDSTDVLFVSHFLKTSQAADGNDLYFGDLPRDLQQSGIKTAIALIDHTGKVTKTLDWTSHAVPRILLNRLFGLPTELRLARKLAGSANDLRRRSKSEPDPFVRDVLAHAAADAGSSRSLTALRIAKQIQELVRRLRPKAIVSTFEGHSWERLAFSSARAAKPDIVCIGYHHTVLFPSAYAMSQSLGRQFDPDHILTAGQITQDWLREQPALAGIPVGILGSVRVPASMADAPNTGSTCLVLPEGLLSESVLLFRLAVETAKLRPDTMFRLRLHPVLPRQTVTQNASDLATLPSNVTWSNTSLHDDLQASRWALYRGSSAIVTATLSGVRPVYFRAAADEINLDPLAALTQWRDIASTAQELAGVLDRDRAMSDLERKTAFDHARDHCHRYFMPMNADALTRLLPR